MEVRVASSCAYSLAGEIEYAVCPNWPWLPMSALPNDDRTVIAQAIDGRVLHIPSALLRFAGSNTTPDHLAFPAVRWRRLGPGAA